MLRQEVRSKWFIWKMRGRQERRIANKRWSWAYYFCGQPGFDPAGDPLRDSVDDTSGSSHCRGTICGLIHQLLSFVIWGILLKYQLSGISVFRWSLRLAKPCGWETKGIYYTKEILFQLLEKIESLYSTLQFFLFFSFLFFKYHHDNHHKIEHLKLGII